MTGIRPDDQSVDGALSEQAAMSSSDAQRGHVRGSSLMVVGRMISMFINLAVHVATVQYLGETDYGIFAYAISISSLAASASLFGQDRALGRFLPLYDERGAHGKAQGAILVAFSTVFLLGSSIVAVIIGLHAVGIDLTSDQRAVSALLILITVAPFTAVDTLFVSLFAVVAKPSAIFWRRHVLTPLLRLASVLAVIATAGSVNQLAGFYLVAGIVGVVIYAVMAVTTIRKMPIGRAKERSYPVGDLYRFGGPMVSSDVAQALRMSLVVIFLEALRSVDEVGAFRAVLPLAQLNLVAMQSFKLLYLPVSARMFGRGDNKAAAELYWQSAAWLAVGTFPIFVTTFAFAEPLTRYLLGEEFVSSASVLAVLALGYYVSAALGLNAQTLKASGRIKLVVAVDTGTALLAIALNLILINQYGALGAAMATTGALLVQNLLVHLGLRRILDGLPLPPNHRKAYVWVAASAVALLLVQVVVAPPPVVSAMVGLMTSILVLVRNRDVLMLGDTFPELARIPVLGKFIGGSS